MSIVDVNIPQKFTEETEIFSGDKTISTRNISPLTRKIIKAENTIFALSKRNKVPLDEVVKRILLNSTSALRKYVTAKGENPNSNKLALCLQAALLRADEVSTIAKALGTSDEDAILQIESAEQDAIDNNNPDVQNILPYDVQAALKLTIRHIKTAHLKNKGSGKIQDFISQAKKLNKSDGFELNTATILYSTTGGPIGSKSHGGEDLPYAFSGTPVGIINSDRFTGDEPWGGGEPWITGDAPSDPDGTKDSSGGGFFSIFDKIVEGIGKITTGIKSAIGTTKSSVEDLLGQVKGNVSDIGKDSIQKAIKDYIPYIIAGTAAIVLIIVIAIYASKNK